MDYFCFNNFISFHATFLKNIFNNVNSNNCTYVINYNKYQLAIAYNINR